MFQALRLKYMPFPLKVSFTGSTKGSIDSRLCPIYQSNTLTAETSQSSEVERRFPENMAQRHSIY